MSDQLAATLRRLGDTELRLTRKAAVVVRDRYAEQGWPVAAEVFAEVACLADDEHQDRSRQNVEAVRAIDLGDVEDPEIRQELADLWNEEDDGEWTAEPPPET